MLLGNRNDVYRLYLAMDVFVFPSRYEGLGMVAVEAQFCGVRTVMSDRVPEDAKVLEGTLSMALSESIKNWAESVLKQRDDGRIITEKYEDYDISKQSIKLVNYYGETVYGKERAANTGQYFVLGKQG